MLKEMEINMENVKGNFNMVTCTLKIKWWNENKTHHNACNSCRTSSTTKHEDFHLGIFPQSFAFKGFNYTKLLHI